MSGSALPRVTILLASYNRLGYLKESVSSALAQDYPSFEVLVIDDGSCDDTAGWLREKVRGHANLRVSWQDHTGVGAARATGVVESRGEIICVLDSDDLLAPNALSKVVDALETEPTADLVYVDHFQLSPDGKRRRRRYPAFGSNRAMTLATFLSPRIPFKHTGTTYRRATALAIGSYDAALTCKVDVDFFLKFLKSGRRLRLVREPLAVFRFHPESVSRDRKAGIDAWCRLIDRHGPASPFLRRGLKLVRGSFEASKLLYEAVASRLSTTPQSTSAIAARR